MESEFKTQEIDNIFSLLSDEQSLHLIGISLAANHLSINLDSLGRYPESESIYFFSNSISIIRELAPLVVAIKSSGLSDFCCDNTKQLYEFLRLDLEPFDGNSLAKAVLKPIRDVSFHYNLAKSVQMDGIKSALVELRNKNSISVGFSKDKKSPLGQRYYFSDSFHSSITNQFLTSEITSRISLVAVNIGLFVDSLVNDLLMKIRNP